MGDPGAASTNATVTVPRFLIEAVVGSVAVLTGPQLQHLRARRLRVGSIIELADGQGRQCRGVVATVDRHQAVIRIVAEDCAQRESPLRLTLALALLKRDKLDWVVEKATELGVTGIVVFTSQRTVSHVAGERFARWTRVARSAAQQSQRSIIPSITGPMSLEEVVARFPEALRLFFWEAQAPGTLAAVREQYSHPTSLLAVVGPEGGFSAQEAEQATALGCRVVGLAPRILRAETAAVAVVTLCQFLWGDLGASNP